MKRILIALALCLLMVGLIVSPASAATQKVYFGEVIDKVYDEWEGSWTPIVVQTPSYATIIKNQGDSAVTILIRMNNADPNTKYWVYVYAQDNYVQLGSLKTNSKGNWGGQNEQYSFEKVLPPSEDGQYALVLETINPPLADNRNVPLHTFFFQFQLTN